MADRGFAAGKVSIVIAVWNGERTLDRCLRSCMEQTYKNKEIIVIDGASSDGTVDIIKGHVSSLAHWVSEPDSGIYSAWNKALRVATGEWICFLGADDVWADSTSLALMMDSAKRPAITFVSGRAQMVSGDGKLGRVVGGAWSRFGIKLKMPVTHVGALHHRSLFDCSGRFDESYRIAGDFEFLLRASQEVRGTFVPEVVVIMEDGGVSNRSLNVVRQEGFRALRDSAVAGPAWAWFFIIHWWARRVVRSLRGVLGWR